MYNKILKPLDFKNYSDASKIRRFLEMAGFFCILVISGCFVYSALNSKKVYSFNPATKKDQVEFSFSSSKNWPEPDELSVGAQYDCSLVNHEKVPLTNWKCEMILPEKFLLDSFWSGNFEVRGNKLTITPLDYNFNVPDNNPATFGFILHSKELLSSIDFNFVYYKQFSPFKMIAFKLSSMILSVILIILVVQYINDRRYINLMMLLDQTFDTIVNIVDTFDEYTYNHSRNVAFYSMEIAHKMKMPYRDVIYIYYTGLVHDIGKISIMRSMLNKKDKFTDEEREKMKQHTVAGSEILKDFTMIPQIQDGALYHHERFDGLGYPKELKGKEIPLFARIICIADCFDAMTTQRSYWEPCSVDTVVEEFKKCSGTQFDPEIVPYMIQLIDEGIAPVKMN